ncbi:MAG: hypothetical protein P8M25_18475 [Paracoccaceae bacterium]|nr:hypothetical protein [Paracoccaceae bacterium]
MSAKKTTKLLQHWGGPVRVLNLSGGDDPSAHLLIGDLMNPGQTEEAVTFVNKFCKKYVAKASD